jgi:hypothetical protein
MQMLGIAFNFLVTTHKWLNTLKNSNARVPVNFDVKTKQKQKHIPVR